MFYLFKKLTSATEKAVLYKISFQNCNLFNDSQFFQKDSYVSIRMWFLFSLATKKSNSARFKVERISNDQSMVNCSLSETTTTLVVRKFHKHWGSGSYGGYQDTATFSLQTDDGGVGYWTPLNVWSLNTF